MDNSLERGVFGYDDDNNNHCCRRKWCVSDVCGVTCAVFTWILLAYGQFCVLTIMMASIAEHPIHQTINCLVFECLFVLAFVAHVKTMLTNPGTVPKGTLPKEYIEELRKMMGEIGDCGPQVTYKCTKCACIRPQRSHHCSVCKRCIRRMDHHCPWVNNCVGENNQKCFVLFTLYVSLVSCQTLYWAVWQFVLCINEDWRSCSLFSGPVTIVLLIVLLFESILFAIFTAVMFGTQLSAICYDQTGIESLRHETYGGDEDEDGKGSRSQRSWKYLQAVFGGPFSIQWLNPLALPFISDKTFEFSV